MESQEFLSTFPPGFAVPDALVQLCAWVGKHGYPISGSFELRPDGGSDTVRCWFGHDTAVACLAAFGAGADGSPYAFWRQDDGRTPIVHMGSEGSPNFVLAANFVDFLRLIAVGYNEIGFEDLSLPPRGGETNPTFQAWVRNTFQVDIPGTGEEITKPAQASHDDFDAWVQQTLDLG